VGGLLFANSCGGGGGPAPFSFVTASLVNAIFWRAYSAQIRVSNGVAPIQWQIIAGSLPPGISFCTGNTTDTCAITGTPTQWSATPYSFTIQVTDSSNPPRTAQKNYTLKVDADGAPLTIQMAGLPAGVLNTAYSADITASGGRAPYLWSLVSGALPDGIGFCAGATGLICALSGTPTVTGVFSFRVSVSDSNVPPLAAERDLQIRITATPEFTLSVARTGNGVITSDPPGIACGADCSEPFPATTQVTLTAAPDTGWLFSSWAGCDTAVGATCTVTLNSDRSVSATITQIPPNQFALTVTRRGNGSITSDPPGIACGADCSETYPNATTVTLTAIPDAGWQFGNWSGCTSENGPTCSVALTSNKSVSGSFFLTSPDLALVEGLLDVPAPLNPADFVVGNMYGETVPSPQGRFMIPVLSTGITITAAVPNTPTEGSAFWAHFALRSPAQVAPIQTGPELVIDAMNTARSWILLHPSFLTPDLGRLQIAVAVMNNIPEIDALANVIAQKFPDPTYLHPLGDADNDSDPGDPVFSAAYSTAVRKVTDAVPQVLTASGEEPAMGVAPAAVLRRNPHIQAHQLDHIRQLTWEAEVPDRIKVEADIGNPLDTYLSLWKVDPLATHELKDGDTVVDTFTLSSLEEISEQRNRPSIVSPRFPYYAREGAFPPSRGVASAKSIFKYLDVIGLILDGVTDIIGLSPEKDKLDLRSTEDALYILRGVNGRFNSGLDNGEFSFVWDNYRTEFVVALSLNVVNGAIDMVSAFVDISEFAKECTKEILPVVIARGHEIFGAALSDEAPPGTVWPMAWNLAKDTAKALATCALKAVSEKPLKSLLKGIKAIAKSLNPLDKISKIGSTADRLAGLTGFPIAPTPAGIFLTPLDSALIVVGDPFSPRVDRIRTPDGTLVDPTNPPAPLPGVNTGDTVVLRGKRFRQGTDPPPEIAITDEVGNTFTTRNPPVQDVDIESPPTQEAQVTIPGDATGKIRFQVFTPRGNSETPEVLEVMPRLFQVVPANIFPNDPHSFHRQAQANGNGFIPARHRVIVGTREVVPMTASTRKTLAFDVPTDLSPAKYEVRIRWRDATNDVRGSDPSTGGLSPKSLRLLGPPSIDTISPTAIKNFQTLLIQGKNFGEVAWQEQEVDVVYESDYPSGSGQNATAKPNKLVPLNGDNDQLAQVLVLMPLFYSDPNPDTTDVFEPMPARAKVKTPEGESALVPFQVVTDPTTPYYRTLTVPYISLTQAIQYANQSPAPAGAVTQAFVCDIAGFCGVDGDGNPIPAIWGDCHITYPDSYVPVSWNPPHGHSWTKGVTPPPGLPPAGGSCNACESPVTCPTTEGTATWEGIAATQITDNITLWPPEDSPGNISLSTSEILRGPIVNIYGGTTDYGKVVGGGLIIEGDGKDGTPTQVWVQLTVEEATGTVITVRNARNVTLNVAISGTSCNTGILIDNSKEIFVQFTRIDGCKTGIRIQNSEQVSLTAVNLSGYQSGVVVDGGSDNWISVSPGFRNTDPQDPNAFIIPPGQRVGVHLTGDTSDNQVFLNNTIGHSEAGLWLESGSGNVILPSIVGVYYGLSEILKTDSGGASTGNGAGIKVSSGASKNWIYGLDYPRVCPSTALVLFGGLQIIGNNQIGILMEGGDQNEICGNYIGVPSHNYTLPAGGVGNEIGIALRASTTQQPMNALVRTNFIGDNHEYGIQVDGVSAENIITENALGASLPDMSRPIPQRMPNPPNGICGLHIANITQNLRVEDNWFTGEVNAICIQDSQNLFFARDIIEKTRQTGIKTERSHTVTFDSESICGGAGDAAACDNQAVTQTGMHLIASSDFRLRKVVVRGVNGTGLDIEQPPDASRGFGRVEGEEDRSTVAGEPSRDDPFDPVHKPPQNRIAAGRAIKIRDNLRGVHIHNGAKDILIAGALIANNANEGIHIENSGNNIRVESSRIGLDFDGTPAGNGTGIRIQNPVRALVSVGAPESGNVISGNAGNGILVEDTPGSVFIQSNFIGTSPDGMAAAPNAAEGIRIHNSNEVLVGGNPFNVANLISGNGTDGVLVNGFLGFPAPRIQIEGNFIGTDRTGSAALPNQSHGVFATRTGGPADTNLAILTNLIGGNSADGIRLENTGVATGALMANNLIGAYPGQPAGPANSGDGISLRASSTSILTNNTIGANGAGFPRAGVYLNNSRGNFIQFNSFRGSAFGIYMDTQADSNLAFSNTIASATLDGIVAENALRNTFSRNSITASFNKGISLINGGNLQIPPPVITSVGKSSRGEYFFYGEVCTCISDGAIVEIFADEGDEGRLYLASTVTANHTFSIGNVTAPPGETLEGKQFHATVTDLNGNTSEFGPYDPQAPRRRRPSRAQPPPPEGYDLIIGHTEDDDVALTNAGSGEPDLKLAHPALDADTAVCQDGSGTQFIAFSSDRDGNRELYLTNRTGSIVTRLTNDPVDDIEPSFSPDCSQIAFVSARDGNYEIYRMSRDGSGVVRLTNDAAEDRQPDWSTDASKIVFSSSRSTGFQIFIMNAADGSSVEQKTTEPGVNRTPAWRALPDRIAFENCYGAIPPQYSPCRIAVLTLAPPGIIYIPNDDWTDQQPEWFLRTDTNEPYIIISSRSPIPGDIFRVYMMHLSGYLLWQITPDAAVARNPSCCLSP
jgi:hypothetical protein